MVSVAKPWFIFGYQKWFSYTQNGLTIPQKNLTIATMFFCIKTMVNCHKDL